MRSLVTKVFCKNKTRNLGILLVSKELMSLFLIGSQFIQINSRFERSKHLMFLNIFYPWKQRTKLIILNFQSPWLNSTKKSASNLLFQMLIASKFLSIDAKDLISWWEKSSIYNRKSYKISTLSFWMRGNLSFLSCIYLRSIDDVTRADYPRFGFKLLIHSAMLLFSNFDLQILRLAYVTNWSIVIDCCWLFLLH